MYVDIMKQRESGEKIKYIEFSANTVAFIHLPLMKAILLAEIPEVRKWVGISTHNFFK